MIAHFLRAQDDPFPVAVHVGIERVCRLRAERKRGRRGHPQLVRGEQVQHPVLQNLGIGGHVLERAVDQPGQHGIGNIADT